MSSSNQLRVHYLPQFIAEHELAGRTVVVVDLLRASTTICHALAAGAREVVPFVEVAEAARAAEGCDRADILLGGERGGLRIDGFDLGNSPLEYTPDVVFARRILFTTTNGTRALQHARLAERVIVGAIVNLAAVVDSIARDPEIDVLCAGTAGHVTREDILAAGSIVRLMHARGTWSANESAQRAQAEWEELLSVAQASGLAVQEQLAKELRQTLGGQNLVNIGQDADLAACADIDQLAVVPHYNEHQNRIYLP